MPTCPKCGALNAPKSTECDGCGVIFADLRRGKEPSASGPDLCSWLDHGRPCVCRGIVKLDGRWLCREHWDAHAGVPIGGRGNYAVEATARSLHMRQWDGWRYNGKTKRLERVVEREPGSDDELVPDEVGQA